jgi:ABC-type Fe3+/spermidine/putrescine transport system ATPase subunit
MIKLEQINKHFDGNKILSDISFQISTAESVALVGPSGSGKTTILRLIAGFETPDSGKITIDDRVVSSKGYACPPHERGIGMVFQKPALWPHMTLAQNILFSLKELNKSECQDRLKQLLNLTHLKGMENRYPHQVSGGEAQRVTLARAIAPHPAILFLDEPMIGMDYELVTEMNNVIKELRSRYQPTIIYVSHDFNEARAITDRVMLLSGGKVSYDGQWEQLPIGRNMK